MRIVIAILLVLLLAGIGGAAYFYMFTYQPLDERVKTSLPEFDKTKAELKKYKEKEKKETAWISPMINTLNTVLSNEIKTGKIEVLSTGNMVVVNISEEALYMPGSKTFAQDSRQLLANLDSLLKNDAIKGKDIYIGNTTQTPQMQGKGKRKIPAKDARTLAAERSLELVKHLEKNGVNPDALIAASYSSKQPAIGSKIKDHKTVILIGNPLLVPMEAAEQPRQGGIQMQTKPTQTVTSSTTVTSTTPTTAPAPEARAKPTVTTKSTTTTTSLAPAPSPMRPAQPKPIPIRPAESKSN